MRFMESCPDQYGGDVDVRSSSDRKCSCSSSPSKITRHFCPAHCNQANKLCFATLRRCNTRNASHSLYRCDMENLETARLSFEIVDEMHNEAEVKLMKSNCVAKLLQGHGEYTCGVCGDGTFSLARLNKHMQFHDCDRPFPCELCGKRFGHRSHHTEHQRVHTGARPYTCDRCEWAFTTRHNLKRHQLVHDKEETYSCNVCGLLFCQEHLMGNVRSIVRVRHEQRRSQIHPKLKYKTSQKKQIHKSLRKLGRDTFERLNTRIQRIAYDIEVVL